MIGPGRSLHNIHYRTQAPPQKGPVPAPFALGIALLVACTPAPPPAPSGTSGPGAPSGPEDAVAPEGPSGPADPAAAAAAVPAAARLPLSAIEARVGGGAALLLDPAAPAPVDPGSAFEVRVPIALRGARLVLLDAQDAIVPATSTVEVQAATRLVITPAEPLQPGARYLLRLEGVESRLVPAADGRTFEPLAVPLATTGEPAPRPPPRKAGKRRSRG